MSEDAVPYTTGHGFSHDDKAIAAANALIRRCHAHHHAGDRLSDEDINLLFGAITMLLIRGTEQANALQAEVRALRQRLALHESAPMNRRPA